MCAGRDGMGAGGEGICRNLNQHVTMIAMIVYISEDSSHQVNYRIVRLQFYLIYISNTKHAFRRYWRKTRGLMGRGITNVALVSLPEFRQLERPQNQLTDTIDARHYT